MDRLKAIYLELAENLAAMGKEQGELVFSSGETEAEIMLIGEAPGKDEVLLGRPFVGKAGKNLDEFLALSGISRDTLFITNVVKFRPYRISEKGRKANRPPTRKEIEICLPCLKQEIHVVRPKWIVTLGNTALKALLGEAETVGERHGKAMPLGDAMLYPLYHPASIIYRQALKPVYEEDVRGLKELLDRNRKSSHRE